MPSIYLLTTIVYWLLPIAGLTAVVAGRRRRKRPLFLARGFISLCATGSFLGVGITVLWTLIGKQRIPALQTLVGCYWMIGLLCALAVCNLFTDRAVALALRRLLRNDRNFLQRTAGAIAAGVVVFSRALLLCLLVTASLAALVTVYRPKSAGTGDPSTILQRPFEAVSFASTDGVRLRGWWIPGAASDPAASDTVLLCHGFAGNKSRDLPAVRQLVAHGYNVLAFDFRAHGQSGGQLTTFGDLERRDVLGAVRWLRASRPEQSHRILGLGIDMGAAALIGAAADANDNARFIDAIIAIDPFDHLSSVIDRASRERALGGPAWLLNHVGLPIAGLECGTNLSRWSPAADIQQFAPRPILIIHAGKDPLIPISSGESLFQSAFQPRYHYWLPRLTLRETIETDSRTQMVLQVFFDNARDVI